MVIEEVERRDVFVTGSTVNYHSSTYQNGSNILFDLKTMVSCICLENLYKKKKHILLPVRNFLL